MILTSGVCPARLVCICPQFVSYDSGVFVATIIPVAKINCWFIHCNPSAKVKNAFSVRVHALLLLHLLLVRANGKVISQTKQSFNVYSSYRLLRRMS